MVASTYTVAVFDGLCPKTMSILSYKSTDYGHPDRAFFQKLETFGLGQINWAEIL